MTLTGSTVCLGTFVLFSLKWSSQQQKVCLCFWIHEEEEEGKSKQSEKELSWSRARSSHYSPTWTGVQGSYTTNPGEHVVFCKQCKLALVFSRCGSEWFPSALDQHTYLCLPLPFIVLSMTTNQRNSSPLPAASGWHMWMVNCETNVRAQA